MAQNYKWLIECMPGADIGLTVEESLELARTSVR
jgi:hypothetical protein